MISTIDPVTDSDGNVDKYNVRAKVSNPDDGYEKPDIEMKVYYPSNGGDQEDVQDTVTNLGRGQSQRLTTTILNNGENDHLSCDNLALGDDEIRITISRNGGNTLEELVISDRFCNNN